MSGETRWATTAVASVVLWFPAMSGTMSGELDMAEGAIRYLVAFAVAWAAVAFVDRLVHGYAASAGEAGEEPRRRQDDVRPIADPEEDPALDLDAAAADETPVPAA